MWLFSITIFAVSYKLNNLIFTGILSPILPSSTTSLKSQRSTMMTASKITLRTRKDFSTGTCANIAMPIKENTNRPNFVVVKAPSTRKLFNFLEPLKNGSHGLTMIKNSETTFENTITLVLWLHLVLILKRECQVLIQP